MPKTNLLLIAWATALLSQTPSSDRGLRPTVDVQRRIALVIGNAAYRTAPLQNPGNDATAMEQALRSVGFEVSKLLDLDKPAFDKALDEFVKALRPGDLAFFYFSGHGLQIDRENFLLPIDFAAANEVDARHASFSADQLQERMERSPARVRVLVLDACRNNPFRYTRGLGGLAPMASGVEGTMISFATAGNGVADDNRGGRNGLFTQYLLETLTAPGIGLREAFLRARTQVYLSSGKKQLPSIYENLIGDLVLRDPALELARLRAENAQLESERAKLEERARKARTEEERREAARQAAEKELLLRIRKSEEERRKEEEAARLARVREEQEAEARQRKEREAEVSRNEELRRSVAAGQAVPEGAVTLEVARREVAALERQVANIRKTIEEERDVALRAVPEPKPKSRGEFETSADFEARVRKAQEEHAAAKAVIEQRASTRTAELTKDPLERVAQWKGRRYPLLGAKLVYKSYDADRELLFAGLKGVEYQTRVLPQDAARLKETLDLGSLETPFVAEEESFRFLTMIAAADRRELVFRVPPEPGEKELNPADGLQYAWIPPGSYQTEDRERITITRGFWLTDSEITQDAYRKVAGKSPSHFKGDHLPVESVNWEEASAYCQKIGGRLPTESEWEHAARAGTGKDVYGELDRIAWYRSNSDDKTHAVRTKEPNAWGLYDMLGNVEEWTEDWHTSKRETGNDPKGPASGSERVARGGSWSYYSTLARASSRFGRGPSGRNFTFGFRCARE